MTPDEYNLLLHYGNRYIDRVGHLPSRRDLDPVLARSILFAGGDVEGAIGIVDAWFDSVDPWYRAQGFELEKLCGPAITRLFAQGDIEPKGGMTERDHLARKLFASLLLRPDLRKLRRTRR
jgi:hypothetical protein